MPPNRPHDQAMSQGTASVFQVQRRTLGPFQTAGILPPPIDRTNDAWNAIANTSRPVLRNYSTSLPSLAPNHVTLLFPIRSDLITGRPLGWPPGGPAPPRYYAPPRPALRRPYPYPTRGIPTVERRVQWNPLPYTDNRGMRNELPYTLPPAVQVARSHYRLLAAPGSATRGGSAPVNSVPPWMQHGVQQVPARAHYYGHNTVTTVSRNYAGPPLAIDYRRGGSPYPGPTRATSYETTLEVPGSPVPSESDSSTSSADSDDTIPLATDWNIVQRKVSDTIMTLERFGPVGLAGTLIMATTDSPEALAFNAVVVVLVCKELNARRSPLVRPFRDSLRHLAMHQFWQLWRDERFLNLNDPLLIENSRPHLKLGLSIAALLGCLFRIGIVHGYDIIKCLNFLINSGVQFHRLSAIHAIITMASVKLCKPKYVGAGIKDIYQKLGSTYVGTGVYYWAPSGPSSPAYRLLVEIFDAFARWFDIQNIKQLRKGGIVTHNAF